MGWQSLTKFCSLSHSKLAIELKFPPLLNQKGGQGDQRAFWCSQSVLEHLCSSHCFGPRLEAWSHHSHVINYFLTDTAWAFQRKKAFNTCTFLLANSYASQWTFLLSQLIVSSFGPRKSQQESKVHKSFLLQFVKNKIQNKC